MNLLRSLAIALLFPPLVFGCAAGRGKAAGVAPQADMEAARLVRAARDVALEAQAEKKRARSRELAELGIKQAEACIAAFPAEAGCHYWRAVNTGLYHRAHVIGYQRGVRRMIEDCKKVIALDRGYDHAGALRILGQIYTKLPQTGGSAESVTRDLDLALQHLSEAVAVAPDYPENHIALAEALIAKELAAQADGHLAAARELAHRWTDDAGYQEWKQQMRSLERKLRRMKRGKGGR